MRGWKKERTKNKYCDNDITACFLRFSKLECVMRRFFHDPLEVTLKAFDLWPRWVYVWSFLFSSLKSGKGNTSKAVKNKTWLGSFFFKKKQHRKNSHLFWQKFRTACLDFSLTVWNARSIEFIRFFHPRKETLLSIWHVDIH